MVPSGKHTNNYGKIHHFQWENPPTKWQFSIVFCMFTRPGTPKSDPPGVQDETMVTWGSQR